MECNILEEKYIERPKRFDKNEYNKTHFKQFNVKIKPALSERINNYCNDVGISKAEFLQKAIDVLEN